MVAASLDGGSVGLIRCDAAPKGFLVPAVILYGATASGKSNVLDAFHWMCWAVRRSHDGNGPGKQIKREPFLLDLKAMDAPSSYDIDFTSQGCRYHYGFVVTDDAFTSEWLYAFPRGRSQILFKRTGQDFKFGRHLKGRNQVFARLTPPTSLFLSSAVRNNHDNLCDIARFFYSIYHNNNYNQIQDRIHPYFSLLQEGCDERIISLLRDIGTGIVGSRVFGDSIFIGIRSLIDSMYAVGDTNISGASENNLPRLQMAHQDVNGREVFFEPKSESLGTRQLIAFLPDVFRALDAGSLFVLDELSVRLHTQACEAIVALFSRPETNPKGAQLITTTHDANLLRSPLLRRDQIWFTEKDQGGATHLYPLTDFQNRKGDNLAKGYLQGRYGAVPFAGAPLSYLNREG